MVELIPIRQGWDQMGGTPPTSHRRLPLGLRQGPYPSLRLPRQLPGPAGARRSQPLPWSFQTRSGQQRRPGLAAWVGTPLLPPPPPHSGSGVSGLARWPHLFPIWPCALRPLRVVAKVEASATVSPFIPPPDPNWTPSRREASLCLCPSPTLWVSVFVGGAASAIQPRLGGDLLPLLRPPVFGCVWGALCRPVQHPALSSVAMAMISAWKGRGSRVGEPSGIRLPKGGS